MIGYENVDERKLLGLFYSKGSLSAMPLLKDNKVLAADSHKAIYINAEVCQGEYEKTEKFDMKFPPVAEQELNIPLLSLQKAYDSLPKVKAKKDSEVYAYFRIDENITIVVAPYCNFSKLLADAKVEL